MVFDIAEIASKLSWWGALLTGVISYLVIAIFLAGYLESNLATQEGNMFFPAISFRLEWLVRGCHWVGNACLIVGIFFAIRNSVVTSRVYRTEKSIVSILAKFIGRGID